MYNFTDLFFIIVLSPFTSYSNSFKYGVEFLVHNKEIKDKIITTNLYKYGCENPSQNDEVKNKIKNTNMVKYGVDNPSKFSF